MSARTAMGMAALGAGIPIAVLVPIPVSAATRRLPPAAFFPEPPSADLFHTLAFAAMDAARDAGADFADIRLGVQREISVARAPNASITVGYGVRARVQGAWGFQHGSLLTVQAVTTAARTAAMGARQYAATNAHLGRKPVLALTPTPVVRGEWRGPCEIDPFTVPLDDYYRAIGSITETAARVHRNHSIGCIGLGWQSETRVFASTTGSLVTQHFMRGGPAVGGGASLPDNPSDVVSIDIPGLDSSSAGFETALRPDWADYLLTGIEEAVRLREIPFRPFQDVGRFPMVFEGAAFANLIGTTISGALDGDRVFGLEADASGISFLVPPEEILGALSPTFSPLLTIAVDRTLPSTAAVQWDDEGVPPKRSVLIKDGHVLNYQVTRETAPALAEWYAKRGVPLQVPGTAVAMTPASLPVGGGGHLHIAPTAAHTRVDDLTHDMTHGFVIRDGSASIEPGLTAGIFGSSMAMEVKRGKIVARTNIPLQFTTKSLLTNNLVALGNTETLRAVLVSTSKGSPWQQINQPVTAPAALCKDIDVFSWAYNP